MAERFDAIVIGLGPGGEVVADRLLKGGKRIALVERELIGGECGYWACIPSKTLLRPTEARGEADRAAGVGRPALDWAEASAYRDFMIRDLDDTKQQESYESKGATVVRGEGRLDGPGRVRVDGRVLEAEHIVIATGSDAVIPPIEGLDDVPVWTNREATTLKEIPGRAVLVGGGPVGIELGQMLARFGCAVTLVQHAGNLLDRESPEIGAIVERALVEDGVDVRTGVKVTGAGRNGEGSEVRLEDGTTIATDVVVIAAGRKARVEGIGLETIGVEPNGKGLPIDERCGLAEGVWAVGDAAGPMLFTHVAKYQGRIVAANILGGSRVTSYEGIPRVVFCDPEVAAVGQTEAQARDAGIDLATVQIELPEKIARPHTYERDPRGDLCLLADRSRGVLVGAWAVAPLAGEWIHYAANAIREQTSIERLLDGVAQFPTYSEGFMYALEELEL